MSPLLPIHIAAGSLAIVLGFATLYARKGGVVHRKLGIGFVYAMLVMAPTGAVIAALGAGEGSVLGGVLATYFVITSLLTVLPPAASKTRDIVMMLFAFAIVFGSLSWGIVAVRSGGNLDGIPAVMFFIFGSMALIGGVSDARLIRAGSIRGVPRVVRHLWRMCFAMWIATSSFFLGQTEHIPLMVRKTPLLVTLAFLPLLVMFYWMWRLRRKRPYVFPTRQGRQEARVM